MKTFADKLKTSPGLVRRTPVSEVSLYGAPGKNRLEVQQIIRSTKIQPRLVVGASNDAYEREADQVADAVMRMPDGAVFPGLTGRENDAVQAKSAGEAAPIAGELPEEEEEKLVSLKADGDGEVPLSGELDERIRALEGGGVPLGEGERAFFEPRFGADFSQVRIHTGSAAEETVRSLNALAFTFGQDIVFGAGHYAPDTAAGRQLLAHELVHTVQQNGKKVIQRVGQGDQQPEEDQRNTCSGEELNQAVQEWIMPTALLRIIGQYGPLSGLPAETVLHRHDGYIGIRYLVVAQQGERGSGKINVYHVFLETGPEKGRKITADLYHRQPVPNQKDLYIQIGHWEGAIVETGGRCRIEEMESPPPEFKPMPSLPGEVREA
ncbi:DUF4157 domain-containing protein [Geobacter grbiciae]|uniref:eCIS core domain-containing protein n=1 Tax=Geobacter grbiciae TaxID=155042 RepID=UPI001FE87ADB|nr:DUF4157 domain-containing protein [Geobacter grbiciae]